MEVSGFGRLLQARDRGGCSYREVGGQWLVSGGESGQLAEGCRGWH